MSSPALDPGKWVDLLTISALTGDLMSVRSLTVVHEGTDQLAKALAKGELAKKVTARHVTVFERLLKSYNNPHLLKEAGDIYLEDWQMPAVALKHFDLARQLAPTDRAIEQAQIAATLAVAREMTQKAAHSGLEEQAPAVPEVGALLHKTSQLSHIGDARAHLDETVGELERKNDEFKTAVLRDTAPGVVAAFADPLDRAQNRILTSDFIEAAGALVEAAKAGAPTEELQSAYGQLGLAAFDQGQMEIALAAFLRVRDLNPAAVEGWFNCGLVYQKMGKLEDALASYQHAVKVAPDSPKPWCNLSSVHFQRGAHAESEKAARRCLALKPDYARGWDNLASALSALDRPKEAAQACQEAIRYQPALHSAWFKFGVINFQLDNMFLAAEAFHVAAASRDFAPFVNYYLAMVEARRGEMEAAVQCLEDARACDPRNELESTAVKEVAAAFTRAGEYQRAADLYSQLVKKDANDFSAWLVLGTTLHRAGAVEAAQDAYLRAGELRPDNPITWHNLGTLAADQGRHEQSCAYFRREVELSPDDAKAWHDLGVSLTKLDRPDEADEAFDHADELVKKMARRSCDLSAAMSIVRRINLSGRTLRTE
jgi:tetratricopeptide (TPR) repeat protein